MKRSKMNASIAEDLKHIPTEPDCSMQGELRMLYHNRWRSDLAIGGKSRKETMAYCVEIIKRVNNGETPVFDKAYFESE